MNLQRAGVPLRTIARTVGLSRPTVRSWTSAGCFPERKERPPLAGILGQYRGHLDRRWGEGGRNAAELFREIHRLGYGGGYSRVKEYARGLREASPTPPSRPAWRPMIRKTAWLHFLPATDLAPEHERYVSALAEANPILARLRGSATEFVRLLRERDGDALDTWLRAPERGPLSRFAASLRQDKAAVRAAATLPWSNGPVEGHIHRLKLVKRSMYGQASFDLLCARVLSAA